MGLKMRDLVAKTDTPKSTILYYIKEGLLPKPKKIKANVHIYDERFVYMVEFIKYLQNNFDASIEQIKDIIQNNRFDFSKGYENLINNLDILMFASDEKIYSKDEFIKELNITKNELETFIKKGLILDREGGFINIDLQVAKTILELHRIDGGDKIIKEYLKCAKKLSKIETEFAIKSLQSSKNKNETSKLLLDTALILKQYIFDSMLFKSFHYEKSTKN